MSATAAASTGQEAAWMNTMHAAARGPGSLAPKPPFPWPPLFERVLYYMFVPELFARIVLEAGLNIYWYSLIQPKLWVFYGLMLVELCYQAVIFGRSRFRLNFATLPFFLLAAMTLHAFVAGVMWGNSLPKVLTDTVPLLVVTVNILLLNRVDALKGFSFTRLRRFTLIYSVVMVWVGVIAVAAGRLSVASLGGAGGQPVCLTILLVHLVTKKKVHIGDLILVALIVGPTVPNLNRTILAVFLIVFTILIAPRILANGRQLYFSILMVCALGVAFAAFVPPESPLMRRIEATIDKVTTERDDQSGSLYERQAEWAAINEKLKSLGPTAQWLGYGAGGVYYVEFSGGNVPQNYSHAHFSWALFRLRFGNVGFLYLAIYTIFLLANLVKAARAKNSQGRIVMILDVWCFVFLFTYVYFNFLVAGLQFADTRSKPMALSARRQFGFRWAGLRSFAESAQ